MDLSRTCKQFDMLMPGQEAECVDCGALLGPGKFLWLRPTGVISCEPVCELCTFRKLSPVWERHKAELAKECEGADVGCEAPKLFL
jgi:hypothetical protein